MRLETTLCFVALLTSQAANGDDQKADGDRLKRDLSGTWEPRPAGVPNSMRHIDVTPTHYTWVTYDSESGTILATSGGTCSVKGDRCKRRSAEFATDWHQHLRGKTYGYTVKINSGNWRPRDCPTATSKSTKLGAE